jgi:hypothetical protein
MYRWNLFAGAVLGAALQQRHQQQHADQRRDPMIAIVAPMANVNSSVG